MVPPPVIENVPVIITLYVAGVEELKAHVTVGDNVGETVTGAPQSTVRPVVGVVEVEKDTDPANPVTLLTMSLVVPVRPELNFTGLGNGFPSEKSPTFTLIGAR